MRDFFSGDIKKVDWKSEVCQDVLDLLTAAFRDSHLCMQAQMIQCSSVEMIQCSSVIVVQYSSGELKQCSSVDVIQFSSV